MIGAVDGIIALPRLNRHILPAVDDVIGFGGAGDLNVIFIVEFGDAVIENEEIIFEIVFISARTSKGDDT